MTRREDKRDSILDVGLCVMHTKGYNGTGVQDIVDAAGIPKGSFYNYFDSKEDFAIQALEKVSTVGYNCMTEALLGNQQVSPLERILRFYTQEIDAIKQENRFCGGCFVGNLCQEMADVNEPIRKKVNSVLNKIVSVVAECLKEAQIAKDLSQEHDANMLAESICNAWEGALMRMKASCSPAPLDAFVLSLRLILKL